MSTGVTTSSDCQVGLAREVSRLANDRWGGSRPTVIVGRHASLTAALAKVARFAETECPVLLTGETGTGKELFARATYLLSRRRSRPFLSVNCAQYHEGQLMASELFGHKRGSFTGAVSDHRGMFEEADGGVIFLDEIGELSPSAQAMLLRVLSEGEIVPVGGSHARHVDVQVIAATSRDLKPMIADGTFRSDLYYRLRYFHIHIPPVRDRGDDWELIAQFYLASIAARVRSAKRLSDDATRLLSDYHWPGNVREVRSVVEIGFHLSDGAIIQPDDFAAELEMRARHDQLRRIPVIVDDDAIARMQSGAETFWTAVHQPFMNREMSRAEAREIVTRGLSRSRGSYKKLLTLFSVAEADYLKFMDFLRHQRLKPD